MFCNVDHIAIYTRKSVRYMSLNKHFMAVLMTEKQSETPPPPQPVVGKLCDGALCLQSNTCCVKGLTHGPLAR